MGYGYPSGVWISYDMIVHILDGYPRPRRISGVDIDVSGEGRTIIQGRALAFSRITG